MVAASLLRARKDVLRASSESQGQPEAMARSLAGPQGCYITGQTIRVNGGLFFGK